MKIKKIGEIEKIGNGGKFNAMYQEKMNQILVSNLVQLSGGWVTWRAALLRVLVWYWCGNRYAKNTS